MKKAIIFDMDGTIVDNIQFHHEAWLAFLEKHHIEIVAESFSSQNHGTANEMIARFFGGNLTETEIKTLGDEKERTYREMYRNNVREVAGFTELVKLAKKNGIKMGLATMSNADNIDFILNSLNVKPYFDVIAGGHQVKHGKPHPEIYERILSGLMVDPKHCLVFEDSYVGVQSARDAGIPVIGVCTTHAKKEFMEWGVESVLNFEEFIKHYFK